MIMILYKRKKKNNEDDFNRIYNNLKEKELKTCKLILKLVTR